MTHAVPFTGRAGLDPERFHALQLKFGINQLFGSAVLDLSNIGTEVDRPNKLALLTD